MRKLIRRRRWWWYRKILKVRGKKLKIRNLIYRSDIYYNKRLLKLIKVENNIGVPKTQVLYRFLNTLLTQLLVYSSSKQVVFKQLKELFIKIKQRNNFSPIQFINTFFNKASLKINVREFSMRGKKLSIPIPASLQKLRLNFLKTLLIDLRTRSDAISFVEKLLLEISDFNEKRGLTYTRKVDAYIFSRQNRRQSRYGYNNTGYTKKNVIKKNKFSFI